MAYSSFLENSFQKRRTGGARIRQIPKYGVNKEADKTKKDAR